MSTALQAPQQLQDREPVLPKAGECACGSGKSPETCCLPYLAGKKKPETAEALMRARYTAFTRGEVDFIVETHHPRTRDQVKRSEIEDWSKSSKWLGLAVLQTSAGQPTDSEGTVTFHARYEADGEVSDHYEHSLFEKDHGEWKFVDAQGLKPGGPIRREGPKLGRNDPCHCGSGKKLKKCHGG